MDVQAKIKAVKESLNATLTKDSTPEEIKGIEALCSQIDEIEQDYNQVVKEKQEVTDLYIGKVKNEGSKEDPAEDSNKEPRSLEEIADELVKKQENKE